MAERAQATAQVVVADLASPALTDGDAHHLERVRRVRDGEGIIATDGRGSWRLCSWAAGTLRPVGAVKREPEPAPIAIAFAVTKGDKPEWTVQKLTEIGVARIVPFRSAFTVVKWDAAKQAKNTERARRIAYEAAMQCRRVWLPEVSEVQTFSSIAGEGFALAAPGGAALAPTVTKLAIGPEGGWSPDERAAVERHFDLGPTILRAETAAVVAAVRLCTG